MVPSSTAAPPFSSSFSTAGASASAGAGAGASATSVAVRPSPPAAPSRSFHSADSPSASGSGSGPADCQPPPPAAGPRKHGLVHDEGLSPASSASSSAPPGGSHHAASENNLATPESHHQLKKRKSTPGSRGVANLTPEQLAKKRANDREAQRAVRERTKNQIERLENRIRELTSLQPYQELQAAIRAKEAVEAENAEIKGRLASIMALIQPILSGGSQAGKEVNLPIAMHPAPLIPPSHSSTGNTSPAPSAASPHSAGTPPYYSGKACNATAAPAPPPSDPTPNQVRAIVQRHQDLLQNLDVGYGEQLKLNFLLDSSQRVSRPHVGLHNHNAPESAGRHHQWLSKGEWSSSSSPTRSGSAMTDQSHQHEPPAVHGEAGNAGPLLNLAPTCPLDGILLAFYRERRQRAVEGMSTLEIVGPRYPSVSSLLNPASSVHPMTKVFADILATFPAINTLPEKVALLHLMFLNMRWRINPTQENYEQIAPWARATPSQKTKPHPAWVDNIPFPGMREKISRDYNPAEFLFDNWFIPFTTTFSINWPYEPEDALLQTSDGGEVLINPVFERHLSRLENWTLGEDFDRAFPNLRGTYNLKTDSAVFMSHD